MALRWLEGFEGVQIEALFDRKYTTSGVGTTLSNATGWQGWGNALSQNGAATSNKTLTTPALVGSVENDWVLGWAWNLGDTSGLSSSQTSFPSVILQDSGGDQLQFEMVAYNENKPGGSHWRLQIRRGSTVLATSDKIFKQGKWYYIEVKATIDPTNGSFEMQWASENDLTPTADAGCTNAGPINTANQGTAGADRVKIALNSAPLTSSTDTILMDDLYVCDGTGGSLDDFLGPQIIELLLPDGNGNYLEWTLTGTASSLVDAWAEAGSSQSTGGDDKRAVSDVLDQRETASYSNPSRGRNVSVNGVLLHTQARMETSGTRTYQPMSRKTTGTPADAVGTSVTAPSTAYAGASEVFQNDPNTGSPWTIANLDANEFGVKLKT